MDRSDARSRVAATRRCWWRDIASRRPRPLADCSITRTREAMSRPARRRPGPRVPTIRRGARAPSRAHSLRRKTRRTAESRRSPLTTCRVGNKKAPAVSRGGLDLSSPRHRLGRCLRPFDYLGSSRPSVASVAPPWLVSLKSLLLIRINPLCASVPGNSSHRLNGRLPDWLYDNTAPFDGPVNSSPYGVSLNGPRCDSAPPKYQL